MLTIDDLKPKYPTFAEYTGQQTKMGRNWTQSSTANVLNVHVFTSEWPSFT